MKNFWLERKQSQDKHFIKLRSSYGTTLQLVDHENEFIDLSQVKGSNSRYKEYDRLKESWNAALEPFDFESKSEHRGICLQTRSGHTIEMTDEPACEKRWMRAEIHSNMGTSLIMKDDNLICGQWANPKEE